MNHRSKLATTLLYLISAIVVQTDGKIVVGGGFTTLTPAGTALLTYWQDIQIADRRLAERLVDTDTHHGEVRLISPGSIGLALHPLLLALQLAQQPGRRLTSAKEVERLAALGWRLDVNRATAADSAGKSRKLK